LTDTDSDGVPDETDNCPLVPNVSQTNNDTLEAGDACQCGDLNNDGVVTQADVILVGEHVVGATTAAILTRCNVIGPSDDVGGETDCDVADAYVLDRFVGGQPVTVENTCDAYTGPF
jgi:hypothetical protein